MRRSSLNLLAEQLTTKRCLCEHAAHFDHDVRTPNGNPAHKYGQAYSRLYLRAVRTSLGTFVVCRDCAGDCCVEEV